VAAPSIFTDREQAFLCELVRRDVEFMIVGLAAAALQGVPAVTQDIDLWFRDLRDPRLKAALEKVGGSYIPPTGSTPPLLAGRNVALFDIVLHMHGLGSFDQEVESAVEIVIGKTRIKVLSLDRIIASKKATNRAKDRLVLPVLQDAAAALKTRGSEKRPRRR
jgi:hypothetical protein